MKSPLQITVREMPASEALASHIREKIQRLEQIYGNLIAAHVVVEIPHRHHHQGKEFEVRINLSMPGHDIVVNHERNEDAYVAFRDAYNAATRQLGAWVRRMHDSKTRATTTISDLVIA